MKKQHIIPLLMATLVAAASCSKMDDYKDKYIPDSSERLYAGKVDSLKIRSGKDRVQVTALFISDPKVSSYRIYWDSRKDSITADITRTGGVDTLRKIITGLSEGAHSFEVVTFDNAGNASLPVTATGTVYGSRYQNSLTNRLLVSSEYFSSGNVSLVWLPIAANTGALGTRQTYTDASDKQVSVFTPAAQETSTLTNYKPGTTFSYTTLYRPDASSIDTFYATAVVSGVKADITGQSLKNAGPNIISTPASGTDRWRIPQDWVVTDDVRNGGNGLGGVDAGGWLPGPVLSIEAWWGMPEIPNGKIYQTVTLPAGRYAFTATTGDCSDGGTKYLTVSAGTSLPDIGQVPSKAIAFGNISKYTDNTIKFELTAPTQVSIGIQAGLKAEGNFMKVFQVRLYSMP